MVLRTALTCSLMLAWVHLDCSAQQSSLPREIQSAELLGVLQAARSATDVGVAPRYEVKGEMRVEATNILSASKITFRPGSRLIFSRGIQGKQMDVLPGQTLIVFAEEVEVEGTEPALISWTREIAGPRLEPLPRGRAAAPGAPGVVGGDGGPGAQGEEGNRGFPGMSAPNLYVIANRFTGAKLAIDMRGQDGSTGGFGQQGGDGGRGGPGEPAVGNILNCVKGAGVGGKGGRGGNGGRGGQGGDGGRGGSVVVISAVGTAEALAKRLIINASGGAGGGGGVGGDGGKKGLGGEPGNPAPPFCRAEPGRRGVDGDDGTNGQRGSFGNGGDLGNIYFSELNDKQLQRLYSPEAR